MRARTHTHTRYFQEGLSSWFQSWNSGSDASFSDLGWYPSHLGWRVWGPGHGVSCWPIRVRPAYQELTWKPQCGQAGRGVFALIPSIMCPRFYHDQDWPLIQHSAEPRASPAASRVTKVPTQPSPECPQLRPGSPKSLLSSVRETRRPRRCRSLQEWSGIAQAPALRPQPWVVHGEKAVLACTPFPPSRSRWPGGSTLACCPDPCSTQQPPCVLEQGQERYPCPCHMKIHLLVLFSNFNYFIFLWKLHMCIRKMFFNIESNIVTPISSPNRNLPSYEETTPDSLRRPSGRSAGGRAGRLGSPSTHASN